MDSKEFVADKPHAVCIPAPAQSHIKAMLKLTKLLHYRGFHMTFVNTEFNHKRFLKSLGPNSLDGLPDFRFEAIPDGIPAGSDEDATQDVTLVCDAIMKDLLLAPFRDLLLKLNDEDGSTPVTSVVSDGFMPFAITVVFFTIAACSFMACKQYPTLVGNGLAPLKDESCFTNGFLDKVLDWIPGIKDIRLRDLPANFRTTDPDDILFNFTMESMHRADKASAIILHTFDALELASCSGGSLIYA
ncbi:putative 7-deoxyloganetin glucosyltransferase [Rosa chinensis]|uniref:Putative 7-deoxyloganetin glucosyltransferase n=1 Tax=Rosa chinensis TaxID=74649 RepID=A0A2P6S0V4_ROSCH|nr:putative 7-deoxyloganetin glucosyltransferase [Rosa chinensis]